ncbi:hypothetical protein [Mucilaginibacter sp.]|uniref:hypothetical protein n=1 Tax=Mucilaginibacter sp. TaxID=1882438 RepID=UPI0025F8D9B5|nr:hypothetical protein [Mucilaginibacter sp.]
MADGRIEGYLQKNLLYAFLINVLLAFLSVQVVYAHLTGSLEGSQGVMIVALSGAIWSVFLTVCSTTIFLNVYPSIRNDKIYVFFTYYLLPIIAALIAGGNMRSSGMLPAFFTVTIPFFISQTIFYIRFLKISDKL